VAQAELNKHDAGTESMMHRNFMQLLSG